MTNQEVYDIGKKLESFNYINQYDLDNYYIGYLIQVENTIYQVIVNQHNLLIDPYEEAEVFRSFGLDGGKSLVNGINAHFPFPNDDDDGEPKQNLNVDPFELISKFDDDGNVITDTSADKINVNLTDFNKPW